MIKLPIVTTSGRLKKRLCLLFDEYGIDLPTQQKFWNDLDKWLMDFSQQLFYNYLKYLEEISKVFRVNERVSSTSLSGDDETEVTGEQKIKYLN